MGLVERMFGFDQPQPKGYYETQRNQWHVPREVRREGRSCIDCSPCEGEENYTGEGRL